MWNHIISFAHRAGFTRNEAIAALFMCSAVISGSLATAFRGEPARNPDFRSLLAQHDSLFAERASRPEILTGAAMGDPNGEGKRQVSGKTASKATGGILNINTASVVELQTLPGIGEATAKKIVAWRTEKGRFTRAEDITNVPTIGEKKFEKMRHRITVE